MRRRDEPSLRRSYSESVLASGDGGDRRRSAISVGKVFGELIDESFRSAKSNVRQSNAMVEFCNATMPERKPPADPLRRRPSVDLWFLRKPTPPMTKEREIQTANSIRRVFTGLNTLYDDERRYYSRRSCGRIGYYDWDLEHAIDAYRGWRLPYANHPKYWELRYLKDLAATQGFRNISANLFVRRRQYSDWRDYATGILAGALRSPVYWDYRLTNYKRPYYANDWYTY